MIKINWSTVDTVVMFSNKYELFYLPKIVYLRRTIITWFKFFFFFLFEKFQVKTEVKKKLANIPIISIRAVTLEKYRPNYKIPNVTKRKKTWNHIQPPESNYWYSDKRCHITIFLSFFSLLLIFFFFFFVFFIEYRNI